MKTYQQIPTLLLTWYDRHARILPWRSDPSPYRVWVSEIMLQQTRVETVRPYFERFIRSIPDVEALANATEEELLKLWEGLGYYRRVINMRKAAETIVQNYNGKIPNRYEELIKLSGIGDYTAAAISSIAFGEKQAVVDGNVLRVVSRITAYDKDIRDPKAKKDIRALLMDILPNDRVGDFNQSIMELGATICIPAGDPKCDVCPLSSICRAFNEDLTKQIPYKSAAKKREIEYKTVLVYADNKDRTAMRKRKNSGLLAGLWEFPNIDHKFSLKEVQRYLKENGISYHKIQELGETKHIFTHKEWHMIGYLIFVVEECIIKDAEWFCQGQIGSELAVPSAFTFFMQKLKTLPG